MSGLKKNNCLISELYYVKNRGEIIMLEKDMYGFVYITTNHINGKKYIGQKRYDKANKWKSYLGSGIHLKRAINKYGSENFSKEIIEDCKTKERLDER